MKNEKIATLAIIFCALTFIAMGGNTSAQVCSGECVPAESCSTTNNHVDTSATDCGGGVCCVPNSTGNNCTDAAVGGACKTACGASENQVSALGCATSEVCCVSSAQSGLTGTGIDIPTNTGLPAPEGGIKQILTNLLTWLLGIVGIIALIGFVISGIQYIISSGNEDMMQTAKKNMLYSIIGVVIALAGFVIVQAIDFALRGMSF